MSELIVLAVVTGGFGVAAVLGWHDHPAAAVLVVALLLCAVKVNAP